MRFQRKSSNLQTILSMPRKFRTLACASVLMIAAASTMSSFRGNHSLERKEGPKTSLSFIQSNDNHSSIRRMASSNSNSPDEPTTRKQPPPKPSQDEILLAEVREHAVQNGAFINDKVEIRTINGVLTGIYAKEPLKSGELAWHIPEHLFIRTKGNDYCDAIDQLRGILTKSEEEKSKMTPYERYLSTRTASQHHSVVYLWSSQGRSLLRKLLGDTLYLSDDHDTVLKDWWDDCDGIEKGYATPLEVDDVIRNAIAILETRREAKGYDLVPFHDVANHARGDGYNVEPSYVRQKTETNGLGLGFKVETIRDIAAGEQLGFSYVDCKQCGGSHPFSYPTDYLFNDYGLIEDMPQYWKLDDGDKYITFKLDYEEKEGDDGKKGLDAKFGKRPSSDDITFFSSELSRLHAFENTHKALDDESIPENELNMIWLYHQNLVRAMTVAQKKAIQRVKVLIAKEELEDDKLKEDQVPEKV